jgi:hypothetical protein
VPHDLIGVLLMQVVLCKCFALIVGFGISVVTDRVMPLWHFCLGLKNAVSALFALGSLGKLSQK